MIASNGQAEAALALVRELASVKTINADCGLAVWVARAWQIAPVEIEEETDRG